MTKFTRRQFSAEKSNFLKPHSARTIVLNDTTLKILLFALIVFVGLSYLYFINQSATGGFDIKGFENSIEQLTKDNKQLEVKTAEMQSLSRIEAATKDLNMESISYIEYLPAVGSSVAVR